jgi:hypothetical protein
MNRERVSARRVLRLNVTLSRTSKVNHYPIIPTDRRITDRGNFPKHPGFGRRDEAGGLRERLMIVIGEVKRSCETSDNQPIFTVPHARATKIFLWAGR